MPFVAVAHAFVTGSLGVRIGAGPRRGRRGRGGRPRSSTACDYAALGHLHRPQEAGRPQVRYAGSLLKYSASEAAHVKAATLVELPAEGLARTEPLPFTPRRDLRRLRGRFEDLMKGAGGNREDYLFLELVDDGPGARRHGPPPPGLSQHPRHPARASGRRPRGRHGDPRRPIPGTWIPSGSSRPSSGTAPGGSWSEEERALFRDVAARALDAQEPA